MSLNALKNASSNLQNPSVGTQSRNDQVKNDDGAFVFEIGPVQRIHRFLVSGTSSNFYRPESQLSSEMVKTLDSLTGEQQMQVVKLAREISNAGRSSKNDYAIFVIGYLMCKGEPHVRKECELSVPSVCRTGTHILQLCDVIKSVGGWSKLRRRAVANWYLNKPVDKLTLQVVKYANRGGWTHRDVMRQIHLSSSDELQRLISYVVNNGQVDSEGNPKYQHELGYNKLLDAVLAVKSSTDLMTVIKLTQENSLPHEVIPSEFKDNPMMQYALLKSMPYTATMRNLGAYSKSGLLAGDPAEAVKMSSELKQLLDVTSFADMQDKARKLVVDRLQDHDALKKARIHPMNVLLALKTYSDGRGHRGSSTWEVNQDIVTALDRCFYASIPMQEKVGKNVLVAMDVSGSMFGASIQNTSIDAATASAAFGLALTGAFDTVTFTKFNNQLQPLSFSKDARLDGLIRYLNEESRKGWNSTDCSLPARHCQEVFQKTGRVYDAIVIMTDNDTNTGRHPYQELNKYRKMVGRPVKQVVLAFSASNFTVADPKDANSMDFPGLDSNLVDTAQSFIKGEF